jgi:hypothetical protein
LDVHAPHEPIHSLKDFFLHLFTITVGLLIAVGIEGCVELHHEHSLVKEARATLRDEIQHNSDSLKDELTTLKDQRTVMAANIKALTAIVEHPADKSLQKASISAGYSIKGLRQTGWKTAQTTGALAFMPYKEAERYASVYEAQEAFLAQQEKLVEDEAQFMGAMRKLSFGDGDTTPVQATAALERFGVWEAHLQHLELMARLSSMLDVAFLEGKEGPTHLSEEIGK